MLANTNSMMLRVHAYVRCQTIQGYPIKIRKIKVKKENGWSCKRQTGSHRGWYSWFESMNQEVSLALRHSRARKTTSWKKNIKQIGLVVKYRNAFGFRCKALIHV